MIVRVNEAANQITNANRVVNTGQPVFWQPVERCPIPNYVRYRTYDISSRKGASVADYEWETWKEIYQKALLELEHAKMRGRIGDARAAITTRVEALKSIPGLHQREYQAIDDASKALRFLESEEDRYDENLRRIALETAAQKLKSIAPKIKKRDESASE